MDGIYWSRAARNRIWTGYRALLSTSRVPLQEVRVPTRSGETCVFTCGSGRSPPLVLLHGGNTNSSMWLRSLPAWWPHFRIYAVDSIGDPGFSASTRPSLHTETHALWLEDLFKHLNLTSASIVGASFGGWLALDFATRRPLSVDALVLLSPAGLVRVPIGVTLRLSLLTLCGAWGRRCAMLQSLGLSETSLTDDQRMFLKFSGLVQKNALSRIRLPAPIPDDRLRNVPARTFAILGGRDVFFDAGLVSRRLRENCPLATVQVIPDAGHGSFDPTALALKYLLMKKLENGVPP